jgi:hypothetical protein
VKLIGSAQNGLSSDPGESPPLRGTPPPSLITKTIAIERSLRSQFQKRFSELDFCKNDKSYQNRKCFFKNRTTMRKIVSFNFSRACSTFAISSLMCLYLIFAKCLQFLFQLRDHYRFDERQNMMTPFSKAYVRYSRSMGRISRWYLILRRCSTMNRSWYLFCYLQR